MKRIGLTIFGSVLVACFAGCSPATPPVKLEPYYVKSRSLPPEPVYSRVSWSHLPKPIVNSSNEKAPYFQPVISFELGKSNFQEAIEALAQTMGYTWSYPPSLKDRPIAIHMVGSVDEILGEISRQAHVEAEFDHEQRLLRVVDGSTRPQLPHN